MWRGNYTTDSGKVFSYVSLVVEYEEFLPEIFKSFAVRGRGFCDLPKTIKPRHAILTDIDGGKVKIECPFRPDTVEWFQFWQEIKSNPLIIASEGIGEIIVGIK